MSWLVTLRESLYTYNGRIQGLWQMYRRNWSSVQEYETNRLAVMIKNYIILHFRCVPSYDLLQQGVSTSILSNTFVV